MAQLIIWNNDCLYTFFGKHFIFIIINDTVIVVCIPSLVADLTEECRKKDLEKTFMR